MTTGPSTEDSGAISKVKRSAFKKAASFILWLSILAGLFLSVVHYLQPDRLAPVTLVPPWVWLIPGVMAIVLARKSVSKRVLLAAIAMWIGFACLFVEEARSILRFHSPAFGDIRVVTLNCCIGSKAA